VHGSGGGHFTLVAAAFNTLSTGDSAAQGWWPAILVVLLVRSGLVLGSTMALLISRTTAHLHQLIQPVPPNARSLTPPYRPGF